jgi:hypothetical protein
MFHRIVKFAAYRNYISNKSYVQIFLQNNKPFL